MQIEQASQMLQHACQHGTQPVVWSVAGSDNTAGAGIQADNKVFDRFGIQSANIVTAITAQNNAGLHAMHICSSVVFEEQWHALAQQGSPDVIKLGMLANQDIVKVLCQKLALATAPVVCDPVLKATSGGNLLQGHGASLYHRLLEYVSLLTPNQDEFCQLFSVDVNSLDELIEAALDISKVFSIDLVVTGGESIFAQGMQAGKAIDVCVVDGETFCLESPIQDTQAVHGTGCSFSSAIASAIALGYSVKESIVLAKAYLNQGLAVSAIEEELALLSEAYSKAQSQSNYLAFKHTQFPCQLSALPNVVSAYDASHALFSALSDTAFPKINQPLGLYPVVDSIEWIEKCLQAGIKTIQLRVKDIPAETLDSMVSQAAQLGRDFKARLFINDHWQLAIKHKAFGVHLGQEDLDTADLHAIQAAGIHLGVSTHSWFEMARAHSLKPSYIAIGPIYETTTKIMPWKPQGLDNLLEWNALLACTYPVVAIGGINASNAQQVLATGVGSIAMVRAITEADDYQGAINHLNQLVDEAL